MLSASWVYAALIAVIGIWMGGFSKQWAKRATFSGRIQHRYAPMLWQRMFLVAASLALLAYSLVRIVEARKH